MINIYFIKETKIANYADDNTIYTVDRNIEDLLKTLKEERSLILYWFRINEIKSNDDNCHLIRYNIHLFIEFDIIYTCL